MSRPQSANTRDEQGPARVSIATGLALACLSIAPARVQAQDPERDPLRLGVFFWHDSPNDEAAFEGIQAALAEVGLPHDLVVGRAGEDRDAATLILEGYRDEGADLVFAMGTQAALMAAARLREIPVVFTAVTNPVESGIVGSWAGSNRNLAGNSNWIPPETILHVFRLTVPGLQRLGIIRSKQGVVSAAELRSMRSHLEKQSSPQVEVLEFVVESEAELPVAVDRLVADGVQAIWIPIDRLVYGNAHLVFLAAKRRRIPLVSSSLRGTRTGATSGVVVDYVMLGKRAAALALSILEDGVEPGSLPVGTMSGYRVVVNIEAARQCGYEVPLSLLLLADVLLERIENDEDESTLDK